MTVRLCVLVMPIDGPKEFYPDAHIAGVWDGNLVIGDGPARMNGLDPDIDVRREIALANIHRVEILEEDTNEVGGADAVLEIKGRPDSGGRHDGTPPA